MAEDLDALLERALSSGTGQAAQGSIRRLREPALTEFRDKVLEARVTLERRRIQWEMKKESDILVSLGDHLSVELQAELKEIHRMEVALNECCDSVEREQDRLATLASASAAQESATAAREAARGAGKHSLLTVIATGAAVASAIFAGLAARGGCSAGTSEHTSRPTIHAPPKDTTTATTQDVTDEAKDNANE